MALPTMQPNWVKNFKNPHELAVKQTQKKDDYRGKWNEANNYFNKSEVRAQKQNAWLSERCFNER